MQMPFFPLGSLTGLQIIVHEVISFCAAVMRLSLKA